LAVATPSAVAVPLSLRNGSLTKKSKVFVIL
jgi:hypothetical protein